MSWKLEMHNMIKFLNFLCPARAEHNNSHKLEVAMTSPASDSAAVTLAILTPAWTMGTVTQSVESSGCQLRMTFLQTPATMRRLRVDRTAAATTEGGFVLNSKTVLYYVIVGCSIIGREEKRDLKYGGAELICTYLVVVQWLFQSPWISSEQVAHCVWQNSNIDHWPTRPCVQTEDLQWQEHQYGRGGNGRLISNRSASSVVKSSTSIYL